MNMMHVDAISNRLRAVTVGTRSKAQSFEEPADVT